MTMVVDDLRLAVQRSARRRTVQITVERDGSLGTVAVENPALVVG